MKRLTEKQKATWVRCELCDEWKQLPHTCHQGRVTHTIHSPHDKHAQRVGFGTGQEVRKDG